VAGGREQATATAKSKRFGSMDDLDGCGSLGGRLGDVELGRCSQLQNVRTFAKAIRPGVNQPRSVMRVDGNLTIQIYATECMVGIASHS
jgi:hypothetical protein